MFTWWRSLTIPQRFLIRGTLGLVAFVPVLIVRTDAPLWLRTILLIEVLTLVAGYSALDDGFASWRPTSRSRRLLRAWMYGPWYFREGDGQRWVRLVFGIFGLGLMALVAFGLAWAAFA